MKFPMILAIVTALDTNEELAPLSTPKVCAICAVRVLPAIQFTAKKEYVKNKIASIV